MFYAVEEDGLRKVEESAFFAAEEGVCILTLKEWQEEPKWRALFSVWHRVESIHYCRLESYRDYLFGTVRVPSKKQGERDLEFALYVFPKRVLLLDENGRIWQRVKELADHKVQREYSIERFFYDFLQSFIADDLLFLEGIEQEIANIEEDVLEGQVEKFSYRMLRIKKVIARFYHYYSQLTEIGQELLQNQEEFFSREELRGFHIYAERVSRLAGETQLLREYAMQVQEVYQSEIGIRQNDVMKMLTIVTTICLPLSLIAGWYGMNFQYMPELRLRHAYPFVIGVCVLIVAASLYLFKKKKYW